MELSPKLYHYFVRPKWFSNIFFDKMLRDLVDFRGKTTLDFGCGIGSSSFLFSSSAYVGVDCDDNRIEYAKKLHPEHNFITIKDERLPLLENSVDYVIILSVLHHIPSESIAEYLKEFKRVLKSDGSLIIVEPCFYEKASLPNWCMSNFDKGRYIRDEDEYLDIFRKANYKTKVIKRYNQLLFYNKIMFSASPIISF
ncbi:class I SAM-dependent methyltransferase [Clostridium sp. DJ247]|uniref:class I SAM-dependent methyltransferase n=1 Tax=Clostridium sp. DJ247 TaxID=2726188 RepID=UPI001624B356|nr:class I SAM-dependent methyltransferase [Clostridium sp. DJ247]MBC2582032.1 class I SAM-dependent methyltransferase [Clostridium sp. DJ247]